MSRLVVSTGRVEVLLHYRVATRQAPSANRFAFGFYPPTADWHIALLVAQAATAVASVSMTELGRRARQ